MRNPPTSSVIAIYTYSGPPIAACGNPTLTISDGDGYTISFLSAIFEPVSGKISISLPDANNALKGDFALRAVFSFPGAFDFSLGLTLKVGDICDESYF